MKLDEFLPGDLITLETAKTFILWRTMPSRQTDAERLALGGDMPFTRIEYSGRQLFIVISAPTPSANGGWIYIVGKDSCGWINATFYNIKNLTPTSEHA
jgi:hypothetical protein